MSDYTGYDLDALWRGRERTTRVERGVVGRLARGLDFARVVELGPGVGRLTPEFSSRAHEYVAMDLDLDHLRQTRKAVERGKIVPGRTLYVQANLHHLPFVQASFTAAIMIRVYHHLATPTSTLATIGGTLATGGELLLSYHPRPSWGTVLEDLKAQLRGEGSPGVLPGSFAGKDPFRHPGPPFPIYVARRSHFASALATAGFELESEESTSVEPLGRLIPERFFHAATRGLRGVPFSTERLAVGRWKGNPGRTPPALGDVIACPRCSEPFGTLPLEGTWDRPCIQCGFHVRFGDGILSAVYLPKGTEVHVASPDNSGRAGETVGPSS